MNYGYWAIGTLLGLSLGNYLPFNSEGIDFVLTALFVTLFLDQVQSSANYSPALAGLIASMISLLLFGPDQIMIPAMLLIIIYFTYRFYRQGGSPHD